MISSMCMQYKTYLMDLLDTPGQSWPGSNVKNGVLHTTQPPKLEPHKKMHNCTIPKTTILGVGESYFSAGDTTLLGVGESYQPARDTQDVFLASAIEYCRNGINFQNRIVLFRYLMAYQPAWVI